MSLTFEKVDEIFKDYGLKSHIACGGKTEYAFLDRQSLIRKRNVATNVKPLINGVVRGYIYVGFLEEYKYKHKAPSGYAFIKTAKGHVKFKDISELELRTLLERVIKHYRLHIPTIRTLE